jgi:hypothetical protein
MTSESITVSGKWVIPHCDVHYCNSQIAHSISNFSVWSEPHFHTYDNELLMSTYCPKLLCFNVNIL